MSAEWLFPAVLSTTAGAVDVISFPAAWGAVHCSHHRKRRDPGRAFLAFQFFKGG
jgi:hypothetical protein